MSQSTQPEVIVMAWQTLLRTFIPLLVSIDPLGVVPVFMTITSGMTEPRRRNLTYESVGAAFAIAIGFMFLGQELFDILSITVTDFQIAGGILLLVLAILDLLSSGKPAVEETHSFGIVPLAMPLIAGPATLTTSLLLVRTYGYGPAALALALNFLLLLGVLLFASRLTRNVGVGALAAFSKIVMLLLAAIAVNFIRVGITQVILDVSSRGAGR